MTRWANALWDSLYGDSDGDDGPVNPRDPAHIGSQVRASGVDDRDDDAPPF